METHPNNITIKDVARESGLSVGTISRVINGCTDLKEDTLKRALETIEKLGYKRHESAHALALSKSGKTVRTNCIGVVFCEMSEDWMSNEIVSRYLAGLERECRNNGYHSIVEFVPSRESIPRCVADRKVDGIIVKSSSMIPDSVKELASSFPVVGVGMYDSSFNAPKVVPDNLLAGSEACGYLWRKGHRRIAFINSNARHAMFQMRFKGYEMFMRSMDAFDQSLCFSIRQEGGIAPLSELPDMSGVMDEIMKMPHDLRPTALLCCNDWTCGGIYVYCRENDLKIPEDFSVFGFDNSSAFSLQFGTPLSTYDMNLAACSSLAATILIKRIEQASCDFKDINMLPGYLVEKKSVKEIARI